MYGVIGIIAANKIALAYRLLHKFRFRIGLFPAVKPNPRLADAGRLQLPD